MAQWSLRTLLIATAVIPLAIFAIAKSTPLYVSAVLTIAAIAWIAVAIMAWIDSGSRQAWARGVILAATAYGLLVIWMGTELELVGSRLATSGALYYAHTWAAPDANAPLASPYTITFTSPQGSSLTTNEITFDVRTNTDSGVSGTTWNYSTLSTLLNQTPTRRDFATIGHVYWGILLGLAGGWFAAWIARRQQQEVERTS